MEVLFFQMEILFFRRQLYSYNTGENQNAGGLFDPIYIYNNSARGRTFIVSFEYKY